MHWLLDLHHLSCTTPFFLISLLDNKIEKVLFAKYVIEELGDDQLDKVLDGKIHALLWLTYFAEVVFY